VLTKPRTRPIYIDKDNEVIVELQTDAPLKRAIMPNGGRRMVLSSLKTYGYDAPSGWWTRSKSIARTAPTAPMLFTANLVCSLMLASRGLTLMKTIL
jgi:hypothetical protein